MSDYNFASEHKDDMRGVFLRLYCENTLADGTTTNYTEEDVKNFLQRYWDGNSEIGYALHDKDIHISGTCKKPHFHIAMWRTVRGNYHFDAIVKALPGIHVEQMKKKEEAFAYLIHATFPDKHQYSIDELHLNFPLEQYEEYVAVAVERYKQKEAKHAEKVAKLDANKNMRNEMLSDNYAEKQHKKEIEALYQETRTAILNGELKQRTYRNRLINEPDSLFAEMWDVYHAKLDKAFKERLEWMKEHCRNRKLTTIVIEGAGGDGKSNLAVQLCERNGYLYSESGSKNDPMQDVLPDDDCYILNEARDDTLSFTDFLMLTEPFKSVSIKSRYANKMFFGSLLIITTPVPLNTWYTGDKVKDVNYNGKNARLQFDRRINYVIKCTDKEYKVYSHDKYGYDHYLYTVTNPLVLKQDPKPSTLLDNPEFVLKGVSGVADTLGVADAYSSYIDDFKASQKQTTEEIEEAEDLYEESPEMIAFWEEFDKLANEDNLGGN